MDFEANTLRLYIFSIFSSLCAIWTFEVMFLNSILYHEKDIFSRQCFCLQRWKFFFNFVFLDGCYHFFPQVKDQTSNCCCAVKNVLICAVCDRQLQITQASVLVDSRKRLLQMYVILISYLFSGFGSSKER